MNAQLQVPPPRILRNVCWRCTLFLQQRRTATLSQKRASWRKIRVASGNGKTSTTRQTLPQQAASPADANQATSQDLNPHRSLGNKFRQVLAYSRPGSIVSRKLTKNYASSDTSPDVALEIPGALENNDKVAKSNLSIRKHDVGLPLVRKYKANLPRIYLKSEKRGSVQLVHKYKVKRSGFNSGPRLIRKFVKSPDLFRAADVEGALLSTEPLTSDPTPGGELLEKRAHDEDDESANFSESFCMIKAA